MHATLRDYVDDMTLLSTGATPEEAAIRLQESLGIVKAQLIQDNMCLNDDKPQIYGNTQAVRHAWDERTLFRPYTLPRTMAFIIVGICIGTQCWTLS